MRLIKNCTKREAINWSFSWFKPEYSCSTENSNLWTKWKWEIHSYHGPHEDGKEDSGNISTTKHLLKSVKIQFELFSSNWITSIYIFFERDAFVLMVLKSWRDLWISSDNSSGKMMEIWRVERKLFLCSVVHQDTSLISGTLRFCLDPVQRFSDEQLWQMVKTVGLQSMIIK